MPQMSLSQAKGVDTDEEIDSHFSGMITSNNVAVKSPEWIIDSGASDHMTPNLHLLTSPVPTTTSSKINLPNGDTAMISHRGKIHLPNDLLLDNVLCIPYFKHNLLSVQKFSKENCCELKFYPSHCDIIHTISKNVLAKGYVRNGLYYLSTDCLSFPVPNNSVNVGASANASNSQSTNNLDIWHHRLGHAPIPKIKLIPHMPKFIKSYDKICITCPMARFTKLHFPVSESHDLQSFDLIHLDIWGPYKECTRENFRYFLTLVDDHTRYTWIYLLKLKSESLQTLQKFMFYVKNQFKSSIKILRSDNALEFDTSLCQQFFSANGITHQTSCIRTPQQNARVERKHRYILETARALRFQANLPLSFWGDCVMTAVHLINRLPNSVLHFKTPYETLHKEIPHYDHLRVFGCLAFASNPQFSTDKFHGRGIPCVHLGYPPTQKGYRLLNLTEMQVFISRDVMFKEDIFPVQPNTAEKYMNPLPTSMPNISVTVANDDLYFPEITTSSSPVSHNTNSETNSSLQTSPHHTQSPSSTIVSSYSTTDNLRRSTRNHTVPHWHQDYVTNNASTISHIADIVIQPEFHCFMSTLVATQDPIFFKDAIQHTHWISAMNSELDALEMNNTWDVMTLPPGKIAIGCKWLYKTKYKPDGSVDRHKARLVILGCRQKYGEDYTKTFAPVAKMATVRTLLAVAAIQDWYTVQMDVSNAFLHGDLFEDVYMKMPQGYTHSGCRIQPISDLTGKKSHSTLVCKLKKSLYGLKQAPRNWFDKLSYTLLNSSFQQSRSEYSLFLKHSNSSVLVVLVYVDDLLICGSSLGDIDDLKFMLSSTFNMKDLGPLRYFLGVKIDRTEAGFLISQQKYVLDLLKEHHMLSVKPVSLPMDTHVKLTSDNGDPISDLTAYQRLMGKLIYLTITQPHIAFTVHTLSQYMNRPTTVHIQAAKRLLRYLAGSTSQGILLASSSVAKLKAYSDNDLAGCPNTRKSTTGYCIFFGHSPISWKSKKQNVVARSSAEA